MWKNLEGLGLESVGVRKKKKQINTQPEKSNERFSHMQLSHLSDRGPVSK